MASVRVVCVAGVEANVFYTVTSELDTAIPRRRCVDGVTTLARDGDEDNDRVMYFCDSVEYSALFYLGGS